MAQAAACELPPSFFETCNKIEFFNVCGSNVVGPIPSSIGRCTRMRLCFLQENQLSGTVPADALARMHHLERVELQDNPRLRFSSEGKAAIVAALPKAFLNYDDAQLLD